MASEEPEVFVICPARSIAPGTAKPFSLSRITETGESRPFPIVIVRIGVDAFFGYVNSCPHEKAWLNIGSGEFFNEERTRLKCGRHGALFEIESGACVEGPCKGASLEPVAVAVIDGEVCLCGITLVEDDGFPDPFEEFDDTMEIMIHPD